jgi:CRP-like cAMP-binding protein
VKGYEVGAVDDIHKPFPAPVVLARVKQQIALREAFTEAREAPRNRGVAYSKALAEVISSLPPLSLQSGDVLINQGEASDCAFFLDRGSMQVFSETSYGFVTLVTLQAPRLIGEIGAFAGLPRTASVRGLTPARLIRISRAQLFTLSRKSPELLMTCTTTGPRN